MKNELYTNCSLVRVPIKQGVTDYQFPLNVDWANEKIDRLVVVCPDSQSIDPVDGVTMCLDRSSVKDLYFTLYDSSNNEIMHDVSYEQLSHRNNHGLHINAKLNLSLCKLSFMNDPASNATLLIYVFYQTRKEDCYDMPKRSVTVQFPLEANQEVSFRDVINYYVHSLPNTVKGMICHNAVSAPVYVSLRNHDLTYQMVNIHSELARDWMNLGAADDNQCAPFLLNNLDIDFDYSRIRNAINATSWQVITFLY